MSYHQRMANNGCNIISWRNVWRGNMASMAWLKRSENNMVTQHQWRNIENNGVIICHKTDRSQAYQ